MSIMINLKPEVEAGLLKRAAASGMTVEDYVQSIVGPAVLPEDKSGLTGEQKAEAFRKWADSQSRDTPLLSDYAVSRESVYDDELQCACGSTQMCCCAAPNPRILFTWKDRNR